MLFCEETQSIQKPKNQKSSFFFGLCVKEGMSDAFDRNTNFGSWDKLGTRYYRKFEVYQMSWGTDVDLSTSIAVAAPYGGPLGLSFKQKNNISQNLPSLL